MRIIRANQGLLVLWKNGFGMTREIACDQPGGRLAWRLSLAQMSRDAPFSAFPGLTRILTVVQGRGMFLTIDGEPVEAKPMQPCVFSGDATVHARLCDGPVANLNLIYDPARLEAWADPSGEAATSVAHVAQGTARLNGETLRCGDTAVLQQERVTYDTGAGLVVYRLAPRAAAGP